MTGIPALALGPVAGLALRFPKIALRAMGFGKFCKAHWKEIAIIVAVLTACVSAYTWIKHDEKVRYQAGFDAAQSQYVAAVTKANKVASDDQAAFNVLKQKYDDLSTARQTQVVTVTKPNIERIIREVQNGPVYRSCLLTDSVFNDLQTETAGVNASIGSSER
jgi:hypothetical protein